MKKPVLLTLKLEGATEIDIHKVTGINADIPTVFTVERLKDGTNRLTYNQVVIPDLTKVKGITFIRHPEQSK